MKNLVSDSSDSSAPPSRKSSTNTGEPSRAEQARGVLSQSLSHKSHDSGFSDSAESNQDNAKSSPSKSSKNPRKTAQVHSEVVHETRTSSLDSRQYHVSKVYFYSVSDIISKESNYPSDPTPQDIDVGNSSMTYCSKDEADHVSILDCESFAPRPEASSPLAILSPPLSPPLSPSMARPKAVPSNCDSDNAYYNALHLEHKPLPNRSFSTQTGNKPILIKKSQQSPRIHTGTSSLGRNKSTRASGGTTGSATPTNFPKTNGSLYECMSLGRPEGKPHRQLRGRGLEYDPLEASFSSGSMSLPCTSPMMDSIDELMLISSGDCIR